MLIYSYSSIIHFNVIICSPIVLRPRLEKVVQGHLDIMYVCMYIRLEQLTNRNIDNTEINVRVNDSSKQLI